jgi:hypothetical protein
MPSIANPKHALKTFEPALHSGAIRAQAGELDPSLLFVFDEPAGGEARFTYARKHGNGIGAIAIITPAEPLNGVPVFQVGYATLQHLRKRGLAKDVLRAGIDEFKHGMKRAGFTSFYLEAIVSKKNIGSQKVAEQVIGGDVKETEDEISGEPAYAYMRRVDL